MATKAAQAENLYDGKHYIINERKVDKFTTLRKRIQLTPAVCEICGMDLIDNSGSDTAYEDMTRDEQAQVRKAVEKHKELVHSPHSKLIINEDEVPTSYLGSPKKKRK